MNKSTLFTAARFVPRLIQVRRNTWIALGLGLLLLFGLLIWAAVAAMGWFFGQVQGWSAAAPEAAQGVLAKVEQSVPGAREKVAEYVSILKPEDRLLREVSGTDLAPVPRYPGLVRTYWHRESRNVSAHYEGRAEYTAVLGHYLQGFAALGYTQELQSATPEAETHVWTQGRDRYLARITKQTRGMVMVEIETTLK